MQEKNILPPPPTYEEVLAESMSAPACEELVIGTLLNRQKEWNENSDFLSDDLFCNIKCKVVFLAAKACYDRGETIDYFSVVEEVKRHPKKYAGVIQTDIRDLAQNHFCDTELKPKIDLLRELWQRRQFLRIGINLQKAGEDMSIPIGKAQDDAMSGLQEIFSTTTSDIKSMSQVVDEYMKEVIEANRNGTRKAFIPSGFKMLENIGAFQYSDMWVIAADSSQGKTSFVDAIAFHAASKGVPTVIYSMEMTSLQLCGRVMATRTGIPNGILNTRPITDDQNQRVLEAREYLKGLKVYFDEKSTNSLDGILSSIRTMHYKKGVKLAIVDYLQIVNFNLRNVTREQAVANAARRFKNLAKELGICIILLSQLSRDRIDPKPNLARLRDSGQITEAADGVILIWRPESYGEKYTFPEPFKNVSTKNTACIEIAKGRNVGRKTFIAGFDAKLTKFFDLDQNNLPKREDDPTSANKVNDNLPFKE